MKRPLTISSAALLLLLSGAVYGESVQSGSVPQHAVTADFNGDGLEDIAVANAFDDHVTIHFQNGFGFASGVDYRVGISPSTPSNFPRYLKVTDVNGDARPDLIVLCSGSFFLGSAPSIQTLLNLGNGTMLPLEPTEVGTASEDDEFSVQFVEGHFDTDRYRDVAVANWRGGTISILSGNGTGHFTASQELPAVLGTSGPRDLLATDLDRDGLTDLWAATSEGLLLIRQTTSGTFALAQEVTLPSTGQAIRALLLNDLDGDGVGDLAMAAGNEVLILEGIEADGSFASSRTLNDPSLNYASDLVAINRDDEPRADLAVSSLDGDTVTVFTSSGTVEVLSTGGEPRRLSCGDLNGDGRLDLLTANEGDQGNPANLDIDVLLSPNIMGDVEAIPDTDEDPGDNIGLRLANPVGVSRSVSGRYWLVESDRMALQEFNPGPNLNLNPSATIGMRIEFTFEIGGVQMATPVTGWVVDRWTGDLHRFRTSNGQILETIPSAITPGGQGFAGLTMDGSGNFYVSDPQASKIHVLDSNGAVVGDFTTSKQIHAILWNEDDGLIYGMNPGRSDVWAYTTAGAPVPASDFVVAEGYNYLSRGGYSGLAYANGAWSFVSTHGLVVRLDDQMDIEETGSISVAVSTMALAIDNKDLREDNGFYALDSNGHIVRSKLIDFSNSALFSAKDAVLADPTFVPGGVAFDKAAGDFLVSDLTRPVLARFSESGAFEGFDDYSGTVSGYELTGGVAADPASGQLWFRTRYGVVTSDGLTFIPVPESGDSDIAVYGGKVLTSIGNPSEVLYLDSTTSEQSLILLPGAAHGGLALVDEDTVINIGGGSDSSVETLLLQPSSSVTGWLRY